MSLTLALGLKYEPLQQEEFSPLRQEGLPTNATQNSVTNSSHIKAESIIDVQAIEIAAPTSKQIAKQDYNYLSYNIHATLNILHAIGTQLDISV